MIEVKNLYKSFEDKDVLKDICTVFEDGKTNLIIGYILAVLMHGFYDTCAMTGTKASTIVFIACVVIMYIFIIRLVKRESVTNEPIYSMFVE